MSTVKKFPGGEVVLNLSQYPDTKKFYLNSSDKIMEMMLYAEAHNAEKGEFSLNAIIPYLPYARQDRRCAKGDPFSLMIMSNLIKSCKFKSVTLFDTHSPISETLINNARVVSQYEIFSKTHSCDYWKETVLIAPDLGAAKKVDKFAASVNPKGVVYCNKKRNPSTGKLSDFEVLNGDLVTNNICIVIDDICDGGGTFIGVGNKLLELNPIKLDLIVTHGIFSRGYEDLLKIFNNIYTTNSWSEKRLIHNRLTCLEI